MTPPRRQRRYPKQQPPPSPPASSPLSPLPPLPSEADFPERPPEGHAPGPTPGPKKDEKNPERLYILTGSAAEDGGRAPIDLVTLIVARAEAPPSAAPEQSALLRICHAPLSVAEISAYLNLPFSVVTVLLTDLLAAELAQARAPVVRHARADRSLLEAVMHGLQRL
ncbi:DUF742 domain-containing protein [Streptomyces poonensis]|uniref:DUF742 domain-containing protein n=1 Tax=Streptomyces poonensis TaxID=68255 RepID=A0A918UH29_9ACTN|nr:DUF742 domain-containing protein [Streptomyces poonensis]GGZ07551.1 hypothetical protein GCM10010365_28350 [Streptomyces poonensis]GLJ88538.1 hypothetical protein GCM10017589_11380 [Streptomyces poonensis]